MTLLAARTDKPAECSERARVVLVDSNAPRAERSARAFQAAGFAVYSAMFHGYRGKMIRFQACGTDIGESPPRDPDLIWLHRHDEKAFCAVKLACPKAKRIVWFTGGDEAPAEQQSSLIWQVPVRDDGVGEVDAAQLHTWLEDARAKPDGMRRHSGILVAVRYLSEATLTLNRRTRRSNAVNGPSNVDQRNVHLLWESALREYFGINEWHALLRDALIAEWNLSGERAFPAELNALLGELSAGRGLSEAVVERAIAGLALSESVDNLDAHGRGLGRSGSSRRICIVGDGPVAVILFHVLRALGPNPVDRYCEPLTRVHPRTGESTEDDVVLVVPRPNASAGSVVASVTRARNRLTHHGAVLVLPTSARLVGQLPQREIPSPGSTIRLGDSGFALLSRVSLKAVLASVRSADGIRWPAWRQSLKKTGLAAISNRLLSPDMELGRGLLDELGNAGLFDLISHADEATIRGRLMNTDKSQEERTWLRDQILQVIAPHEANHG